MPAATRLSDAATLADGPFAGLVERWYLWPRPPSSDSTLLDVEPDRGLGAPGPASWNRHCRAAFDSIAGPTAVVVALFAPRLVEPGVGRRLAPVEKPV